MITRFEGAITSASYLGAPELEASAEPKSVLIINHNSAIADDVFVSFDGGTDHGRIAGGANIKFGSAGRKVFLRKGSGGDPTVQVISEG